MKLEDFIKNFANQFDDTDESEITAETVYTELDEWSSLTVLSIIAMVKTDFGKDITAKQIRSCDTIEDLYNLVNSL
jgi:acyl carrier protein